VHRYVSRPLADLSAKVLKFSSDDSDRSGGSEVELLGEEFRRLDQQLDRARSDLEGRHWRELELERELQRADRLATIGALAAGLAHEIGTPMGVIRVRAEDLQQDETFSADSRVKLGVIVRQIDRIARIVRMLLDYARKSESHKAICDLRAIADRALALLEPEAAHRNVKTLARLGEIPLLVNCDADQIEQVFVNMIMNALDAKQRGGLVAAGGRCRTNRPTAALGRTGAAPIGPRPSFSLGRTMRHGGENPARRLSVARRSA
jgi:signal transduction histidine kinase